MTAERDSKSFVPLRKLIHQFYVIFVRVIKPNVRYLFFTLKVVPELLRVVVSQVVQDAQLALVRHAIVTKSLTNAHNGQVLPEIFAL